MPVLILPLCGNHSYKVPAPSRVRGRASRDVHTGVSEEIRESRASNANLSHARLPQNEDDWSSISAGSVEEQPISTESSKSTLRASTSRRKRAAAKAAFPGSFRTAAEVQLTLFCPWAANPRVLAATKPWVVLHRAVARGRTSVDE